MEKLQMFHKTKDVAELLHLYKTGALELSPAFQRKSVWTKKDRQRLVDTVLRNYPLPALFLYRENQSGQIRYSVIDGKQRLETIFGFLGAIPRLTVDVKVELDGYGVEQRIDGRALKTRKEFKDSLYPEFLAYQMPIVEVAGGLGDIVELFVRINSTGKALSAQEKRNARYSGSHLLHQAASLACKYSDYFQEISTFSEQQIRRMKLVEFMAELIVSFTECGPINKKTAVDRVMSCKTASAIEINRASEQVVRAVEFIRRNAPDICATRFRKVADLYTLLVVINKLTVEGAVLTDTVRNEQAWGMLKVFGSGVDNLNGSNELGKEKRARHETDAQELRDYLDTVLQGTDAILQRRKRQEILLSVLDKILIHRDKKRAFTPLQRRILWNTSEEKKCCYPNCKTKLDWDTFTMDHIWAHSKGGRTSLDNAALMCRFHNSSKGNRTVQ